MMNPSQDDLSAFQQSPFDGTERKQDVVDMLEGKLGRRDAGYLSEDKRKELQNDDETFAACRDCGNYLSPGEPRSKCAAVTGTVEAGGVCDMFDPSIAAGDQGQGTVAGGI